MKKIFIIPLFSLLLFGCQDVEQKKEIETKSAEEIQKEIETALAVISEEESRTVYESNSQPRSIRIHYNETIGGDITLLSYCWKEDLSECSQTLKQSPEKKLGDLRVERVAPSASIPIYTDPNPHSSLPFPTTIELYQKVEDELIPVTITNDSFTSPSENGVYTYVVKTIYDDEFKGVAFYAFNFRVAS